MVHGERNERGMEMVSFKISVTDDYQKLVPFLIANELEFSEDDPAPENLVKCWEITDKDDGALIGACILAKREGEFIVEGIAIDARYRKGKLGRLLINRGIEETLKCGGRRIFLVARAPGFFRKQGFVTVSEADSPDFFECLDCPQYGKSCHPEVMRFDL